MDITFAKGEFKIKGKAGGVRVGEKVTINDNFVIDSPGEYEVGGVSVVGFVGGGYIVEIDGLRLCTATKSSEAGAIDILVMETVDPEMVKQIDPWVVVTTGKEGVAKYTISRDKLPSELTTVCLTT
ncbi:MAG: hypothetical protein UX80_C0003G0069 [Candidatus Amesbacteria bacterium GW2011_GWA2_47_11b]|uniref:Uncharacterized protein n=3 Tax=Candidatus Amesiibacteriota TaxID=1752730 RepID=A0A0G1SK46_9BACT|nr:MAG: hypothetical protein UX42_C0004G0036 [Microgenomates group bacterium GW2011_GWC1_46_20]KKU58414.1 MAG: hypothetical protein UX80_C0003G0069 [Candidatus Amesbacteria bacterium GW2011_GWA2_47_11b]KKU69812.1 MAG: hypothetical protein UX92_C0009G0022 [Candidatus Amesbacteria bacterium GW2011_GWA1_47_20]KKU84009.1 MAG: hypothetical protein UY11_C0008G0022 [Candidatus Amesbacteria bacterium GW2011_GWC2_47_8]